MQIISVRLVNYRCFKDSGEVPLEKFSVLIGKNDGGKTSFLKAIDKALNQDSNFTSDDCWFEVINDKEKRENQLEVYIKLGILVQDELELRYHIRTVYSHVENRTYHQLSAEIVDDDELNQDFSQMNLNLLKGLCSKYKDIEVSGPQTKKDTFIEALNIYRETLPKKNGWIELPSNVANNLPKVRMYESVEDVGPNKAITDNLNKYFRSELLASHQVALEGIREQVASSLNSHAKSTMLSALSAHCNIVKDISIDLDEKSFTTLNIGTVRITQPDGKTIDWDRIGAGKKREMALGIFRWQNNMLIEQLEDDTEDNDPNIILFDEPDINLDYAAQRLVNQLLQELAEKYSQTQVVVATHAINIIDSVPLSSLNFFNANYLPWRFEFDEEAGSQLEMIRQTLGLSNSSLFNENLIVIVEGDTEMFALPPLFRKQINQMMLLSGVYLVNGRDKNQALHLATLLRKGKKNVMLLLDSDCIDSKNKDHKKMKLEIDDTPTNQQKREIKAKHLLSIDDHELFFLGKMEFEDMFSNDVWCEMLKLKYAVMTGYPNWKPDDIETLRGKEKFSEEIINLIEERCSCRPGKPEIGQNIAEISIHLNKIPSKLVEIFNHMSKKI